MKWQKLYSDKLKLAVALFVIFSVSVLGVKVFMLSQAATGARIYVAPATSSVAPGGTLSVEIREDSGLDPVNSVQASLGYDSSQLQFVSITEGTDFPTVAATSTDTPGVIRVGRAVQGEPVTGDKSIVTVNFKVLANTGSAAVSFDEAYSFIVRSTDNTNILSTSTGGSYSLTGSTTERSASMSLSPASSSVATGSTFTVTLRENSGPTFVNAVQSGISYDPAQLQFISMASSNVFSYEAATDTNTAGKIKIARTVPQGNTGVSGDNPVVTITFKVLAASGSSTVTVDQASSFVVTSDTNEDILKTVAGSTITVTAVQAKGTLSLSPASGTFSQGATVSVAVKANSPTAALTTVQSAFTYPANQLEFVSVTEGSVFTTAQRTNTANGVIDIIRARSGGQGGVTGENPVVTVNFKVIGTTGTAPLTFTNAAGLYDDSGTGTNLLDLSASTPASYTITAPTTSCTTNPTSPSGLTRTAFTYTSITFSWTASTPGSGCTLGGYQIFRGPTLIGNITNGTSFTDGGLTAGISNTYSIKAYDTANHTSVASTVVTMSTKADDMAPTSPVGITAAAPNPAAVNISWTASNDLPNPGGVGIAGYRIYRNGSAVPTYTVTSGTTFSDTNVAANTTYTYTVAAYDKANNTSAPSSVVSAKTPAPVCSGSPTAPSGLTATGSTITSVSFSWNASTPSAGCSLAGYRVYRGTTLVGTVTGTNFTDSGLNHNTNYTYTVEAYDTSANTSPLSTALTATTATDTTAPTAPSGVTASAASSGQVNLSWAASTDNVGVNQYHIYRNNTFIKTVSGTTLAYSDTTVSAATDYTYAVSAKDGAGNESAKTTATPNPVRTPAAIDAQAPTVPSNVRTLATTTSSVTIAWNASTDNVAVAGYHVYRGSTYVGDATTLSYSDTGLTPGTEYTYTVKAFDKSGNTSAASVAITASTLGTTGIYMGDLNLDGHVDILDISQMLSNWKAAGVPAAKGDINRDGIVDVYDLSILLSHYEWKIR